MSGAEPARNAASAHHDPRGGYRNPWPNAAPKGLADLARWSLQRNFTHRPPPDPDPSVFPSATPAFGRARGAGGLAITWIGHSTAVIEFDGVTLVTDPIWSRYASPVPARALRRWVEPAVALDALPRVDIVLVSHNHYDHMDAATVRRLSVLHPDAWWCTPVGNGALLERWGARRIVELDWWGQARLGAARVACVPAQHFSARGLHDRNRALWGGFTVRVADRAVYFAGDTGYHPEFGVIGSRHGPFDVQLVPIGAYEPRWFMRAPHMNPEEAVTAHRELGGGIMVPIHWGTFKLTDEPMDEPPRRARAAWADAGLAPERLWLLRHGETRAIG